MVHIVLTVCVVITLTISITVRFKRRR